MNIQSKLVLSKCTTAFLQRYAIATLAIVAFFPLTNSFADAQDSQYAPQASQRSYGQNFKDMVLARCVAQAYGDDKQTVRDVSSSYSALIEWTYFDMDNAPDAMAALVDEFLARDYRHPLATTEESALRFDFLKCLDLYHSEALEVLTKDMVPEPEQRLLP